MKLGIVAAAILAAHTLNAQDCPICPGGTNFVGGGYTNTFTPAEYPLDTLLVRVASITNGAGDLVYTNFGWVVDTNGLLLGAGSTSFDASAAAGYSNLMYTVAITNTSPLRVYTLQFSTNLAGPYTDVTQPFVGTTNNSEYFVTLSLPNVGGSGFWIAKQQDGFIVWAMAWTNGIVGGTGNGCPGTYHGYINYAYHLPQWGFYPNTNVAHHTFTDLREPTNHVELFTDYGYFICNTNTVDWTNTPGLNPPLYGTRARTTVFFKTYPTNQAYPAWFRGFYEPTNNAMTPHLVGPPPPPFYVQPFIELDTNQMNANGFTTNDLMTGQPDNN